MTLGSSSSFSPSVSPSSPTSWVLKTSQLGITFGGLKAVSDLDLEIPENCIFGLIGPNGAGKTTVFNLLTGVYSPTQGQIHAFGERLNGLKPYEITRKKLARTFQNIRLFKELTVLENVLISIDQSTEHHKISSGLIAAVFRTTAHQEHDKAKHKQALDFLKALNLDTYAHTPARNLPYGYQRRLEIARALGTGAKLLLLDEPAAGMNSQETASLMDMIRQLRDQFKMTILLIEHDMKLVMGICERIAVLDYGVKIAEGTPTEIQKNSKVIEAYLGTTSETPK